MPYVCRWPMNIITLTLFLILINIGSLFSEIKLVISLFSLVSLFLAYFFRSNKYKGIFKISLLISSIIILRFIFKGTTTVDVAISFVVILSTLKFWELETANDHFNMFLILCLSEASIFLLNPSFILFVFGVVKIFIFLYLILKLRNFNLNQISFKRLIILVTPSIVFAIILFYTFPRFTTGFLNTQNTANIFQQMNDNSIEIKNLPALNLSTKKIFKAYIDNQKEIDINSTYWREAVLWDYVQDEWRQGERGFKIKNAKKNFEDKSSYTIEVSEGSSFEVPTIDFGSNALTVSHPDNNLLSFSDSTFRSKGRPKKFATYSFSKIKNFPVAPVSFFELKKGTRIRSENTELDKIKNIFFKDFEISKLNGFEKLKVLNNAFIKRGFQYSLSPPQYKDSNDFLINGKSGYCSHFATSYALLARIINLPSRVVVGYLGGELNDFDNSIIVRELDAHAWVEIYLENKGWVRVDPTGLVAPERLQLSSEEFLLASNKGFSFPKISLFTTIGMWMDSINSKYGNFLSEFDNEKQQNIFSNTFLKRIPLRIVSLIVVLGFITLSLIFFHFFTKKSSKPHLVRYRKFLNKMQKLGIKKYEIETASEFAKRVTIHHPELKSFIELETSNYIIHSYKIDS